MFAGRHPWKEKLVMDVSSPRADRERVGDVTDRLHAALVVDDDGDDVEAAGCLSDPLQLEVSVGELREPILLPRVHASLRRVSLDKIAARLDLDEDEGFPLLRDQIDLARTGADIPVEDRIAAPRKEPGGLLFSLDSGGSASVGGHGATPWSTRDRTRPRSVPPWDRAGSSASGTPWRQPLDGCAT